MSEKKRRGLARWVLDASALLAVLNDETGADQVQNALGQGTFMSSVNLSEVVGKLSERAMDESFIRETLNALEVEIQGFDESDAYRTGILRNLTRAAGLSLGDRACLALAWRLDLPALTADKSWKQLNVGVRVHVLR